MSLFNLDTQLHTVCTGIESSAQCNATGVTPILHIPFSLATPAKREPVALKVQLHAGNTNVLPEQNGVGEEFNVSSTNIMDLSGIKLKINPNPDNAFKVISDTPNEDAELMAITNNTCSVQPAPEKKKRAYKPRVKKDAQPSVTAAPSGDGVLVASFDGENPAAAHMQLLDSVHDFSINETLFKPEELELNPVTDVFIKNSRVKNDELVKYYILKYKICDYNCSGKFCPMKAGIWRRRPAYLILNRKNNKATDLTIPNISLICPNCYVQDKGTELFNKFKNQSESKCVGCGYPVKKGYELCYVCTEKVRKVSVLSSANDMAELTLRTSVTMPNIKQQQHAEPTFGLASFSTDIDKEMQELGIKFANANVTSVTTSSTNGDSRTMALPVMVDVDAELAKYKNILDSDMGGQTKTKRKTNIPSGDVHYTKHKPVNTNIINSALNTNVTQDLLDQLADI